MRIHRLPVLLAAALLAACGSYTVPDSVIYGQAVFTQPKPGFDFGPLRTYYLDPSVLVVADDAAATTELLPAAITSTITSSLAAYGWSPETIGSADVGIEVMVQRGTSGTYSAGYWCNYSGYTGCYAGWEYAGVYQFGTAVLQMGAPATPAGGQLLWMAVLHGVTGGGWDDPSRVNEAVGRAFGQSPYLAH